MYSKRYCITTAPACRRLKYRRIKEEPSIIRKEKKKKRKAMLRALSEFWRAEVANGLGLGRGMSEFLRKADPSGVGWRWILSVCPFMAPKHTHKPKDRRILTQ